MPSVVARGGWYVLCREPHLDGLPGSPLLGLGQRGQHLSVGLGEGWLEQSGRLDAPPGRGGYARQLRSFLAEMYDFHAANQRLHHLLFHAAEVSEDEPLEQARAALARFVARGAQAGELTADDPEETASFLLDGLHGLLLRSLHTGRSRRDFTGAAWSLCARLLAITR